MIPAATNSLLNTVNSIENNALSSVDGTADGLTNELFSSEFSAAIKDILSADGNFKPLDVATLNDLSAEQLAQLKELTGIELPTEIDASLANPILNLLQLESDTQFENVDLFGNPDANTALKSTIINPGLSEDELLNKTINKTINKAEIVTEKTVLTNVLQQSSLSEEGDAKQLFDDIELSQFMKEFGKNDIDKNSDLLIQAGRKEFNTTKLVDQLSNMDKPTNAINSLNNTPLKTYSSSDQSGVMLNRIEVPVNQAGWGEAVGNRMMIMANGKVQSANIQLNPVELGPIEIRVSVNSEQQTSVHIVASNSVVRNAIEDAFPQLKEMFSQNGLSLADANVSQQSPQQGGEYGSEEKDSLSISNENSVEAGESQKEHLENNVIDIGLINHYV